MLQVSVLRQAGLGGTEAELLKLFTGFTEILDVDKGDLHIVKACQKYLHEVDNLGTTVGAAYAAKFSPTLCSGVCQDPFCGEAAIIKRMARLVPGSNPTLNRETIDVVKWVLLNYKGYYCKHWYSNACLHNQVADDDARVRAAAVYTLAKFKTQRPEHVLSCLLEAIEYGHETDDGVVQEIVRTLARTIMPAYNSNAGEISTELRNRAIATIGNIAVNDRLYGQRANDTAKTWHANTVGLLDKPIGIDTCVLPPPDPFPEATDHARLQRVINGIIPRLGLQPIQVTGSPNKATADAAFAISNQIYVLGRASDAVRKFLKCPTVQSTEMLAVPLATAFSKYASGVMSASAAPWIKPVAIGAAVIACGLLGYAGYTYYYRKPR